MENKKHGLYNNIIKYIKSIESEFYLTTLLVLASIIYPIFGIGVVIITLSIIGVYIVINRKGSFQIISIDIIMITISSTFLVSAFLNNASTYKAFLNPFAILAVWFMLKALYKTENSSTTMLKSMIATSSFISILIIINKIELINLDTILRSSNQISIILFISTFYLITIIQNNHQINIIGLLILNILGLIILFSRSSILALGISLLYYFYKSSSKLKLIKLAVILFVFLLVLFIILPDNLSTELLSRVIYKSSKGLSGRDEIWGTTLNMLNNSPFFGYSWEYPELLSKIAPGRFANRNLTSPHNTYFHYGLIGGYVSIIALATLLLTIFNYLKRKSEISVIMRSLFLGFIVITFFESLVIGGFGLRNILFTIIIASSLASQQISEGLD